MIHEYDCQHTHNFDSLLKNIKAGELLLQVEVYLDYSASIFENLCKLKRKKVKVKAICEEMNRQPLYMVLS